MPPNTTAALPNLVLIPKGQPPLNAAGMALANLALWQYDRIAQTGMLAAAPEGPTSLPLGMPANPAATQRRVWLDEPPGSVPFDEKGAITLPPAPTPGVDIVVVQFVVPTGYDGVINYISNNAALGTDQEGSGDLVWRILINDRPVRNFGNITFQNGTIAQGRIVSPIRIFTGQTVTYTVQYAAGIVTGQVICSLSGYFYPSKGIS